MRKRILSIMALVGAIAMVLMMAPRGSLASSHREAPLISKDPTADNTDLYAFVSPDKPDTVTIVANYIPLEEPAGGPNFNTFDDNVRYEIKVDNTGDGNEDITYQFRFRTSIQNQNTFLYATGPIKSLNDPNYNIRQYYSVFRIESGKPSKSLAELRAEAAAAEREARRMAAVAARNGEAADAAVDAADRADEADLAVEAAAKGQRVTRLGSHLPVPPVNVGPRSTPNYEQLAAAAVKQIGGNTMVFAGQRDDPFFVDLGSIFDLGGLRPFNPAHLIPLQSGPGIDGVGGYNTHSIVIQVPSKNLVRDSKGPTSTKFPTIGIYASASRQATRVLRSDGSEDHSGKWVQVSRLGEPLINEVIIPLKDKDRWNALDPSEDKEFVKYYRSPMLAGIVNLLYGKAIGSLGGAAARTTGRDDLVAILLTGLKLPNGEAFTFTGDTPADLLRLNVAIKPNANGACFAPGTGTTGAQPSPLGVLAGDLCGFPNGRRLSDDVTDIELRAVADGYGSFVNSLYHNLTPNHSPNNLVGDGVNKNDMPFLAKFPYVATPHQGYDHTHHDVGSTSTPPLK
jgi:hypothetical protein